MSPLAVFRTSFRAYAEKDRALLESVLADDFRFTSPIDNGLDRATYLEICWPNSERVEGFVEVFAWEDRDSACIAYEGTAYGGERFRNCEIATVHDGRLVSVEVYFGWTVPHPVPVGSHSTAVDGQKP